MNTDYNNGTFLSFGLVFSLFRVLRFGPLLVRVRRFPRKYHLTELRKSLLNTVVYVSRKMTRSSLL